MPWNRRRARLNEIQLQRTNRTLSTQLLQLREQLRNKESYAAGLEILLRQRNERIDQTLLADNDSRVRRALQQRPLRRLGRSRSRSGGRSDAAASEAWSRGGSP